MAFPLPDPYVSPHGWDSVQRNFEAIARLAVDTGSQSLGIRIGTGSAVFTAATTSAAVTVAHGLGRTPVVVMLQELNGFVRYLPSALGTVNFTVTGYVTNNVATTGTLGFMWIAIG